MTLLRTVCVVSAIDRLALGRDLARVTTGSASITNYLELP